MTLEELIALAETIVKSTQRKLPVTLREIAENVPVVYHDWPSDDILGNDFDPDILGMFVGPSHGMDLTETSTLPPQVLLFVENLWDYAESDREIFIEEVRLTYLHELGHYFGWDEDEIAARGLD